MDLQTLKSQVLEFLATTRGTPWALSNLARVLGEDEARVLAAVDLLERQGVVVVVRGVGPTGDRVMVTARENVLAAAAGSPCPPVIPGTYHGRVTINGQPVPEGTALVAEVAGIEWARAVAAGGRYVMDVPDHLPAYPPCFEGGTVVFRSGSLTAHEQAIWRSGLQGVDLTFEGSIHLLETTGTAAPRLRTPGRMGTGRATAGSAVVGARPVGATDLGTGEAETQYFVAHEFSRAEVDDLRKAIAKALAGSGLRAYYADNEVREGHIFKDKILPKIAATRFGIYDLSNPEKPNVFMELGAAMGMGKPYFIICRQGTKLPSDVQGLDRIEYESYVDLTRQLKGKITNVLQGGR
jgi:hypothetical protein